MAGKSGIARQLERVRPQFVQELDINKILPRLLRRGILSVLEEKKILGPTIPQKRIEVLLDVLSRKDRNVFVEFCRTLEECSPHLLTLIVLDAQQGQEEENPPTQALQLGFEIALKERDAVLRDNAQAQEERDVALRQLEQIRSERDQALVSLENLTGKPGKAKDKNLESSPSSPTGTGSRKMKEKTGAVEAEQAHEEAGPNVLWETHNVRLAKAPTFGFGIAVSGGRDSPHFANGDPSVAISDVLKAGPAEGKLQINDRIVSVNGVPLENVDHNTAIGVLRDCGNIVNLVVRRRVLLPAIHAERSSPPFKITLSKKNKKDEFGIVLGCKLFIKEISHQSLASQESALKEGDTILKINNTPVEHISLADAKKLIEKSRDKLQLIVKKERGQSGPLSALTAAVANDVGLATSTVMDKGDVNVYRPPTHPEEDMYGKDLSSGVQLPVPPGAYPNSENTRYDGHYVLDNDLPSLPQSFDNNIFQHRDEMLFPSDHRDSYRNDQNGGWQGQGEFPPLQGSGDYIDDDIYPNRIIHDLDPRSVTFPKDKQTGLGLRLAGGNATGIFIASVQPGSAGEREGLVEGDQIILTNEKEITGLTREEAVSYLTSLEGQVTLVVQYRKEEYDRIMASHEAGDSFYIRTHFSHSSTDISEHSFKVGDIFHVKDTLFRGIGGSWLALRVSEDFTEQVKGTIPNSKIAEVLKNQQKEDNDKENFPNRGRGSLFKRKSSSRRVKSLGKDHWDEVIFAGLSTKFAAYERVVYRDPGFVRPVVIFGAIADIARERLLAEYPDRFDFPQVEKATDQGEKREKSAIIRLGSIREAITYRKHCLLDVTPQNVDRLNYAQFNPIVIFLKAETKQAVKDVRGRWKTAARSARKLLEQSEKIEKEYSYLFTGQLKHMGTDAWFPKLCEMIDSQQRQKIWMSEKQPAEDMSNDFMFPMSSRLSYAAGADSDADIPRPQDDLDMSPMRKQRLVRSSSDPSVNTHENIMGIPPYPSPPVYKNQRIPSHDSRYSPSDSSPKSPLRVDYQVHPEDRYYPSYYSDNMTSSYPSNRSHIDPYATLTPAERLRSQTQQGNFYGGGYDQFGPYRERIDVRDGASGDTLRQRTNSAGNNPQLQGSHAQGGGGGDHRGYADNSSHSSDSYSKHAHNPQNKHDDTKLREKFGNLQSTGKEKGPAHDPYRFTRSTAHPVTGNVDKAKISDLSARYRKQDGQSKPGVAKQATPHPNQQPITKKEQPPPVPVKTYSLKQRGIEPDEQKLRNYENYNRGYNISDINTSPSHYGAPPTANTTPPLPPPPSASSYPSGLDTDRPYEHMSLHHAQSTVSFGGGGSNNRVEFSSSHQQPPPPLHHQNIHPSSGYVGAAQPSSSPLYQQQQQRRQEQFHQGGRGHSLDSNLPPPAAHPPAAFDQGYQNSKAYSNEVYMDHQDLQRARMGNTQGGGVAGGYISLPDQVVRERTREEFQGGIPTLERGYARPRTDDEQLQEIQRSRYRAKSETRLAEISGTHPRWNNTSSSISLHNDNNSNAPYLHSTPVAGRSTILMTGHSSRGRANASRYKSWDASRTDANFPATYSRVPANSIDASGSAFSSYKKPVKQASFSGTTSASANSAQSSSFKDRRPVGKQKSQSTRSHSAGGSLSSMKVYNTKPTSRLDPIYDSALPPLPPPLHEFVELGGNFRPKGQRRSRSPSITFPPPPDFPPPVLSFLPLPPPPEQTAVNSRITSAKKTAAPLAPADHPHSLSPTPHKATLPLPVTENESSLTTTDGNESGKEHSQNEGGLCETTESSPSVSSGQQKKEDVEANDEKHTIVATAKGIFTSKGGLLESPETGVSILVPEGAIEDNFEQEIYFKVCRDNSLLPPLDTEKGETLLSPLVMCGPHGTKFLKPVELRLPHCASANPESWSFALKSSESPSGQTAEWQNMTLAGSEGGAKGRVNHTSVSILVDHF